MNKRSEGRIRLGVAKVVEFPMHNQHINQLNGARKQAKKLEVLRRKKIARENEIREMYLGARAKRETHV